MANPVLEPIAIVGLSCRLPGGADTPEKLWDIVSEGRQHWTDVPEDRYNWTAFHHPDAAAPGTHNSRGGFFLQQDVAEFDAGFFGIPAAEANSIDPQQRILLEVTYEALENAGIPIENIRGSQTGVYVALVSRDYDRQIYKDPSNIPKHHLTGCGDATACGRISYVFDLKGPSMSLDTGCSGSMVALHLACQALRLGETTMAIIGGTNLLLGPDMTMAMSALHMINDNGRCYPFDSRGAGYGRAEGVAAIVIKRLKDALRNGDSIRAVIRNTGVNQDGKTNGILLPSSQSQLELTNSLYRRAGIDPESVAYVEAHGTGTQAGDAAEMNSIREVFAKEPGRKFPLFLGSLKANLGHSESTSGLASIIKSVLVLEKAMIPPVAALETMKDIVRANLASGDIIVPRTLLSWPHGGVRRLSVNSFGFGGTNAHVILESAPSQGNLSNGWHTGSGFDKLISDGRSCGYRRPEFLEANGHTSHHTNGTSCEDDTPGFLHEDEQSLEEPPSALIPRLFVVSAKSKLSLEASVRNLNRWLESHQTSSEIRQKLAYTLASRRSAFAWRTSIVAATNEELVSSLAKARLTKASSTPSVVFLFTGQGAQYHQMGRELLGSSQAFTESLQRSRKTLLNLGATWDLLDELQRDETVSRINSSELSQPSTTAIQIAIVDHLTEAGVKPTAVLGHSSGEVAAAYAAGILSQEAAITISYHKGFVAAWCKQAATEKGAMLAAGLGEVEVSHYLKQLQRGTATVACVNSPSTVTISGDAEAVAELKDLLDRQSIFNRQLKVEIAYHSHHMRAIAERFHKAISEVPTKYPQTSVSFFSSVTGCERLMEVGPTYWVDNLVSKVRFSEALEQLVEMFRMSGAPPLVLVEVGPHPALQSPLRQTMTSMKPEYPKWSHVSSLVRKKDSSVAALEMLGSLFEQGVCINVDTAPSQTQMLLDLEPYPWDHSNKYWHESRLSKEYRFRRHAPHDLLGLRLTGSTILEPIFRHTLSVDNLPWLQEHIIDGFALYPGSAFLCMAIEGLRQTSQDRGETRSIRKFIFKDVVFSKALVIPDSPGSVETMISLKPSHYSNHKLHLFWEDFRVSSLAADGTWNEHCQGLVRPEYNSDSALFSGSEDASVLAQKKVSMFEHQCAESLPSSLLYEQLRQNGIDYGDLFSIIKDLRLGHCKALGAVEIPDVRARMPSTHMEPHIIHPAVFDAFMHIVLPLYHRQCSTGPVMLTSIREVSISADILKEPGSRLTVVCDLAETGRRHGSVDVTILQEGTDGRLVEVGSLSKEGFQGIGEGSGTANSGNTAPTSCYGIKWIPVEMPSDGHGRIATPEFQILSSPETDSSKILVQQLAQQLQSVNTTAPHCVTPASEAPSLGIMINDATMVDWGKTVAREETLKTLLSQSQKTLWVVTGIQSPTDPRLGMQDEIARDVRQDHPGRKIVTFCCDKLDLEDAAMLENIVKVIALPLNTPDEGKEEDWLYFWYGGSLLVPRLMLDAPSTEWLAAYTGQVPIEEVSAFHRDDRTLELDFKIPGLLDSAVFVPSLEVMEDLEPDEVCIKVYAHTVSQKDVAIATGRDGTGATYVGEFAGTVTAAGSTAQANYAPGDRVCGWSSQPYTNTARVKSHLVQKIGDTMTFTEAASIPLAFQTAYHALVKVAQMQEGQTVLVHGAAGAVGQAALALAQHVGACVFATVSDEEKAYLLVRECAIPRHQVFSNRSTSFKDNILRATQGHGVDIVLNCSSEALVQESVSCVADLGILIDMTNGRRDIPLHEAGKNITFARVDMFHFAKQRRFETEKVFAEVMALYQTGKLRPLLPLTTMPITRISDAFKLVQSQRYTGKVVLEAGDGVCVRQIARKPATPVLDPNGTFVVVGGSITTSKMLCTYLASRGAKHITVISTNRVDEANRSLRSLAEELHAEIDICTVQSAATEGFLEAASSHASITKGIRGAIRVEMSDQLHAGKSSRSPVPPAQDYALNFLVTVACHDNPLRGLHMSAPGRATAGIRSLSTAGPEHRATLHIPVVGDNNQTRSAVELDALLDYCLSPSTEKDRSIELYAGVETRHLSSMAELGLQQDPVMRAFIDTGGSTNADHSKAGKTGFEHRLMQCHSVDQAREMVTLALVEQLATFIAIDADDIRPTEPVAAVGLDSLLAIEFKNWIVRIFQAPMQTSEILDAASINELADLIVKRSRLVDKLPLLNGNSGSGMPHQNGNMSSLGLQAEPEMALTPPEDSARPPPLPIPELSALLERNLTYLRAFASEEEFHNSKRLAEEFQAPGSMGRRLYDRLHALREADPEDWYANLYYRSQYLSRKGPLAPWINFFFTHPFSPVQHSQAERAAIITSVVVSYKKELEAGKVRPRYLNEQQLCMDLYKNLFNTSREPCVGPDIMHKHPDNNYFVVFRRGHLYRVDFDHDGDNTVARYAHLFGAILNDHLPVIDWLGVLTTDNRMSWAKNRQAFIELSEQNAAYILVIEQAAFVICLDDGAPETPEQRARQFHFGDGSNRWHDKSIEFIITTNGMSGILGDHTGLDAGTVYDVNVAISEALQRYRPDGPSMGRYQETPLRIGRTTSDAINSEIRRMQSEYQGRVATLEYRFPRPLAYGSALMKAHKIPPNSAFQLVVQLAARHHFGYTPACWETVLQSTFRKGRVEINQIVSPQVKAFVDAAVDDTVDLVTCKQLFIEAARAHSSSVLSCTRAGGSDRFLTMLRELLVEGEEVPGLFNDPVYTRNRPRKIMSNCHKTDTLEDGCTLRDPEGVWLHVEVDTESVKFSMQGHNGNTTSFCEALTKAADKVQKMFGA